MTRKSFVTVSIRQTQGGEERRMELGEFHSTWESGVTIGRDPRCTVVLTSEEVPPIAARVVAASNHKLLYRLPPETTFPLPPMEPPFPQYDERVDYNEFQVGPYLIRFGEI